MSSSEFMMSYWLTQSNPIMLESPSESTDDAEDDDASDDVDSGSQSEGSKDYDDDDFDNRSLEIDEEERHKISAQINPDEEEEEEEEDVTEEEEKEEIIEKEDSGQEKNLGDDEGHSPASRSSDRADDTEEEDKQQGHATAATQDDGETSMTESAESRTLESYGLIQKLESERKQLLQELARDEQHRQYFYNKMKTITQRMESLQQSETNCVQLDMARRQLEMEAYRVQEAMHMKLGLQEESKLRQEASLDRVRNIEAEIISLQMQARKTPRTKIGQEHALEGCASEKTEVSPGHSISLSTPTGDTTFLDIPDGFAPGIPMSANHLLPYHDSWSLEKESGSLYNSLSPSQDLASLSFSSMNSSFSMGAKLGTSQSSTLSLTSEPGDSAQTSGTKVEMVYSLLSMLGTHDKEDMSRTLLAMSQSQENCVAMRQSGCLPLLLQVLHGSDKDTGLLGNTRGSKTARARASAALHNMVHCHHDDKRGRREARTLRLLEQIRAHCDQQRGDSDDEEEGDSGHLEMDHHQGAAIAALMKLSFDEDYRHAICTLGGLQAIAELLEIDNRDITPMNDYSTTIRRYSCMALTNLTFGDGKNKALLCSVRSAMEALTDQLRSSNEDLIQAAASVLRNLSWRADLASKKTLREIGVVTTLMTAAMSVKKETTLKSILSALWNLSSHCSENKAEICAVGGALQFLVSLLTYKSTAKTLAIIENGGGILRNVSSHIAVREDYRQILRRLDCLKILLCHLKSPSLTVVSNACGTLWNLSARCEEDQNALRDMGAVSMLRNLVHSRHKMISSGSSASLKNLLTSIPAGKSMDSDRQDGSPRPSLHVRRQRALEAELDHNLSETCENVDSPRNSPTEIVHRSESEPRRFVYHLNTGSAGGQRRDEDTRKHMTRRQMMPRNGFEDERNFETSPSGRVARAGSQDSVGSTHSDISHDRTRGHMMVAKTSFLLQKRQSGLEKRGLQPGPDRTTTPHNQPNTILSIDQPSFNSSGLVILNDTPVHVSHQNHDKIYYQHNQDWQTVPHGHISQCELVNMPDSLYGSSSLTQSAPSHCQSFCPPDLANNRHQQQTLLERLAKSSSGLSGSCNLNNSITVANNDLSNSTHYSSHLPLSLAADGDQPLNYSSKHQDGVPFDRNSKTSPNSHNKPSHNISFDPSTMTNFSTDLLSGSLSEPMKSSLMNERNCLMNNTIIHEKAPINNRQISSSGSKTFVNSVVTPHRPVPNLLHNHFHGSEGLQSAGATQHPASLLPASCPLNPSTCQYSCQSLPASHQSLPSQTAAEVPATNVRAGITGSDQFNPVLVSQMHLNQNFNKNIKLESDFLVDSPPIRNLSCSEFTPVTRSKKYQEPAINYSPNVCNYDRKEGGKSESVYENEPYFPGHNTNHIDDLKADDSRRVCGSGAGSQITDRLIDTPSPGQDLHGDSLDDNLYLEEKPMGCPAVSCDRIEDYNGVKETDVYSNWRTEKTDEKPATFRNSSSSESISMYEMEPARNCQVTGHTSPCKEILNMPSSPGKKNSPAKRLKDFFAAPKSRNVVTKQSLNLDKSPSEIKPDTFISFATFDEEDKPIHFAMKNQDLPLSQPFPRLEIRQPVGFTSFETEQEQPHLTFSTFQKNFQPPISNHSNHFTNRLCTPRAKTLPTLIEQIAETESSSSTIDVSASCVEEKCSQNIIETPTQNMSSEPSETSSEPSEISSEPGEMYSEPSEVYSEPSETSSEPSETKQVNTQNNSRKEILPSGEEKQFELKNSQTNLPTSFCVTKDTPQRLWSLMSQDDLEPSESEESEEETISPRKIYSSTPLEKSSDETLQWNYSISTVKKRSGIPMKTSPNAPLKTPNKFSSIPKPMLKRPATSSTRSGGSTCQSEQLREPAVVGNQLQGQLYTPEKPHEKHLVKQLYLPEKHLVKQLYPPEKHLYSNGDDHTEAAWDNKNTDSEISDLEISDPEISPLDHKTCATSTPSPEFILPDTARIHYIEDDIQTSLETDSDITLASESPAAVSRSPRTRKTFGFHGNDIKRTYMERTTPTRSTPQRLTNKIDCQVSARSQEMEYINSESSTDSLHMLDVDGAHILFTSDDSPMSFNGEKESRPQESLKRADGQTCSQVYADDFSSSTLRELHDTDLSTEENVDDTDTEVRPKIFYIGDTTDCSSKNSSLHSLNNIFQIEQLESPLHKESLGDSIHGSSCDTNECMPHESSCGKFRDDSSTEELVEQCITSPFHKSNLPRIHDKARRDSKSRIPGPTQLREIGNYYATQSLTKNSSLNTSNDGNSSSDTDQDSQSSASHDQSSDEHSTSQSCSDTPYLGLDLQIPPFFSRLSRCNTWCQQSKRCHGNNGSINYEEDFLIGGISPEETERLLTENVNLIMSEIQTNKMSGSSIDEDLFIENETISLVSNGYTSDTNSEVSVAWSVTSEKTSNLSAASLARNQGTASIRKGGPRFMKPECGQSLVKKAAPDKEEIKTVRGRRKPLYPGKPAVTAVAVKGNIKTVTPKSRAVINPAGSKIVPQGGATKTDASRPIVPLKKTPPKTTNVTTISPKTTSAQPSGTKIKSPPQNIVHRRSRSAGPATPSGKNGALLPAAYSGKAGPKGMAPSRSAPQTSPPKLIKAPTKAGEQAKTKLTPPTSSNTPPQTNGSASDQCRLTSASTVSPGHSRIPTGAYQSQSKIPSTNSGNKNTNIVATANNKKNVRPVSQASRSTSSNTLSSLASEKKAGQNTSNCGSNVTTNTTASNRNSDSYIPRRKSSSSSAILNNADSNKQTPTGSTSSNKRTSAVIADSSKRTSPVIADSSKRTSPIIADSGKRTSPVAADAKKNNSSITADSTTNTNVHKRVSPGSADINKCTADSNKRSSLNSADPSKRTSPNNHDLSKRSPIGSADPNKRSSLGNTDQGKRSSLSNTDQVKRSSLGSTDQVKRSSLGNTDPVKRTFTAVAAKKQTPSKIATLWKKDGPLERSPSGGGQAPLAAASSKLPVYSTKSSPPNTKSSPPNSKPSNLPRQGFKAKAATLPNSSPASSQARSLCGRISKSSTYEKISTDFHGVGSRSIARRVETVKKPAESNKVGKQTIAKPSSDRRLICDTSDDDDDDEDNDISVQSVNGSPSLASSKAKSFNGAKDSLENVFEDSSRHEDVSGLLSSSSNHGDSLEQIDDLGSHIDSRTFRKKKRDQYISDLDLPNADETCRSMSSLSDSHGSQQFSSMGMPSFKSSLNGDGFLRKMSIIDILESEMSESSEKSKKLEEDKFENKSKSTVAQGLKRLFAGKPKDKERETKDKNKDVSKSRQYEKESKTKHSKSNTKHKKGGRTKREYDFFRSNIKIEPSTTWTDEDCLVYNQETSSVPPIRHISHRTDSLNPAIIPPVHNFSNQSEVSIQNFSNQSAISAHNFTNQSGVSMQNCSNQSALSVQNFINQSVISVQNDEQHREMNDGDGSSSEKHMTKTEMLLARRHKTSLSNSQLDLGHGDGVMKIIHAVTAV